MTKNLHLLVVFGLAGLVSCDTAPPDVSSQVTETRVLAVVVEPPEAAPGESITASAVVVGPTGELTIAPVSWDFCEERKPLSDPGPVSPRCASGASRGAPLAPLIADPVATALPSSEVAVHGVLPYDACRLFGPEQPVPKPGEPAGRPADPDGTGGYYQPIFFRTEPLGPAGAGPTSTLAEVRLACGLGAAPQAQIVAFGRQYTRNQNPTPGALVVPTELPRKARGFVHIGWPSCPPHDDSVDRPAPCGGAETYVRYDSEARALTKRTETMRVSWFTTRGTFDAVHTGANEPPDGNGSVNGFTVPDELGSLTLWAVVRDERGGVAVRSANVVVVDSD